MDFEVDHQDQLVDLVDETGKPVGTKRRQDIDKWADLYNGVYVLLLDPSAVSLQHRVDVVLSRIPERLDLPNRYSRRLGTTVATIRRHGETPNQAAWRALNSEVFSSGGQLRLLGQEFRVLRDGGQEHRTYMSAYSLEATVPSSFNRRDITELQAMTPRMLDTLLNDNPAQFAPTLVALWTAYRDQLPV
jgi:hypothetical protein